MRRTALGIEALEESLAGGRPEIFNTDQGSPFTSETLRIDNIQASRQGQTVRFTAIREICPGEPIELTLSFTATRAAAVKVLARLTSESLSEPQTKEEATEIVPR